MLIAQRALQVTGCCVVALTFLASASATTTAKKAKHVTASTTHHSSASHSSKHSTKTAKSHSRGQRGIDEDRTRAIQTALIREHYLDGEPTGQWNQSTKDALVRYQAANGWQTKITPDSRALIKLGLGPDKTGLLNPETAAIGSPHEMGVSGDVQPGGASDQQ